MQLGKDQRKVHGDWDILTGHLSSELLRMDFYAVLFRSLELLELYMYMICCELDTLIVFEPARVRCIPDHSYRYGNQLMV